MSLPELTAPLSTPWLESSDLPDDAWTVDTVVDPARFESMRTEWNELLESSDADCFFLTWEWLHTWWKRLGGRHSLSLVVARRGSRLMGLAPLCVPPSPPLQSGPYQLLGTGVVGSDYLDLVLRRDREPEALEAVADSIARAGRVVELRQLPRGGSAAALLKDRLEARGWHSLERVTDVCPIVDLEGVDWESYVSGLGRSHRQNLRRRLRKLHDRFVVDFHRVESEEELPEASDVLWTLHQRRWDERGGSDALDGRAVLAFHREVMALALRRGWLRLFVLRLDGKPAAALYGFRYRDRFLFYQSGFDPAFGEWSVGLVTMGLAIRSAIEEGVREYDLLHGDERYKFHWAGERRELERIELYPPSLGPLLRKGMRRVVRRAKDQVRDWLDEEAR